MYQDGTNSLHFAVVLGIFQYSRLTSHLCGGGCTNRAAGNLRTSEAIPLFSSESGDASIAAMSEGKVSAGSTRLSVIGGGGSLEDGGCSRLPGANRGGECVLPPAVPAGCRNRAVLHGPSASSRARVSRRGRTGPSDAVPGWVQDWQRGFRLGCWWWLPVSVVSTGSASDGGVRVCSATRRSGRARASPTGRGTKRRPITPRMRARPTSSSLR